MEHQLLRNPQTGIFQPHTRTQTDTALVTVEECSNSWTSALTSRQNSCYDFMQQAASNQKSVSKVRWLFIYMLC
jgi:hypothetical protein